MVAMEAAMRGHRVPEPGFPMLWVAEVHVAEGQSSPGSGSPGHSSVPSSARSGSLVRSLPGFLSQLLCLSPCFLPKSSLGLPLWSPLSSRKEKEDVGVEMGLLPKSLLGAEEPGEAGKRRNGSALPGNAARLCQGS